MDEAGRALDTKGICAAEIASYDALATALMACTSLQQLVLNHIDLVHVLNLSHITQKPTWPVLTSVSVSLKDTTRDAQATMNEFMTLLRGIPSLQVLRIAGELSAWEDQHALLLGPLRGHPSLTMLDFEPLTNRGTRIALAVIAFSLTCPSLTHAIWNAPALTFARDDHLFFSGAVERQLFEPSPEIEAALKNPALQLRTLRFSGVAFSPGETRSLIRGVAGNTSLVDLDFSGSLMELSATQAFEEVLVHNDTLEHLTMPRTPANYFLAVDREISNGFVPAAYLRTSFRLDDRGVRNAKAQSAFDRELRWHSNIVIDGLQAQLTLNRWDGLRRATFPVLQADLAQFLAITARSGPDGVDGIRDFAGHVVALLGNEKALRSVVHLSELGSAFDRRNLSGARKGQWTETLTRDQRDFVTSNDRPAPELRRDPSWLAVAKKARALRLALASAASTATTSTTSRVESASTSTTSTVSTTATTTTATATATTPGTAMATPSNSRSNSGSSSGSDSHQDAAGS